MMNVECKMMNRRTNTQKAEYARKENIPPFLTIAYSEPPDCYTRFPVHHSSFIIHYF